MWQILEEKMTKNWRSGLEKRKRCPSLNGKRNKKGRRAYVLERQAKGGKESDEVNKGACSQNRSVM